MLCSIHELVASRALRGFGLPSPGRLRPRSTGRGARTKASREAVVSHRDAEDAELACQLEPRYLKAHAEGRVNLHDLRGNAAYCRLWRGVDTPGGRPRRCESSLGSPRSFGRGLLSVRIFLIASWSIMAQALCKACPTDLLREQATTCLSLCFA